MDTYSVAHAYFNIMKFLLDQKVSLLDVVTSLINERRKNELLKLRIILNLNIFSRSIGYSNVSLLPSKDDSIATIFQRS